MRGEAAVTGLTFLQVSRAFSMTGLSGLRGGGRRKEGGI